MAGRKRSQVDSRIGSSPRYKQWLALHDPVPRVLYHYTTAEGLLAMLQTGRLWATDSRYMNDPSELRYSIELLGKVLEGERRTNKSERFELIR